MDANNEKQKGEKSENRRQFLRKVGGWIFGLTLVDSFPALAGDPNDEGCSGALDVVDQYCGTIPDVPDQTCGMSGDGDYACTATNIDQSCERQPGVIDLDQSCSANNPDGACGDGSPGNPLHVVDQTCGTTNSLGVMNADSACDGFADPDNSCVAGNTDADCTTQDVDATCWFQTRPLCPDEHCNTIGDGMINPDGACGAHGPDAACDQSPTDEACRPIFDVDEACRAGHTPNDAYGH